MAEGIELKPLGASAPPPPPRHPDSAPGSLGKAYRSAEEKAKAIIHLQQDAGLDAISVWALVLSSWFVFAALFRYIAFLTLPAGSSYSLYHFSCSPASSSSSPRRPRPLFPFHPLLLPTLQLQLARIIMTTSPLSSTLSVYPCLLAS